MTASTPEPTTDPQAGSTPTTPETTPSASTPPWGSDADFNPEKAWNLIQGLKADKEKLSAREFLTDDQKAKLAEFDKLAEASKTELEKAQEAASKVPTLEGQNLRLQVAIEKGLVGDKANLVGRLQGSTKEELAADADALLALMTPSAGTTGPNPPKPNPAQGGSGGSAPTAEQLAAQAAAQGDWRKAISHKADALIALREQTN